MVDSLHLGRASLHEAHSIFRHFEVLHALFAVVTCSTSFSLAVLNDDSAFSISLGYLWSGRPQLDHALVHIMKPLKSLFSCWSPWCLDSIWWSGFHCRGHCCDCDHWRRVKALSSSGCHSISPIGFWCSWYSENVLRYQRLHWCSSSELYCHHWSSLYFTRSWQQILRRRRMNEDLLGEASKIYLKN